MRMVLFAALLMSLNLWAKPVVLVSYFDAFDKAPFNSSEIVARALFEKLQHHPDFDLKLCSLSTVFDKSYGELENCLKSMDKRPALILGLGESNCNFKIEFMARNLDNTKGPDNEGNQRKNTKILSNGEKALAFNYPLEKMYCALDHKNRNELQVSNNAGTFVCNNLAYQFTHYYSEEIFGFIHVPAHNCKNLNLKTQTAITNLERMIPAALNAQESKRLPMTKTELLLLREETKSNACLNEFYKKAKGIDEKGLWTILD